MIQKENKDALQSVMARLFPQDRNRIYDGPALHVYLATEEVPHLISASSMHPKALGLCVLFKRTMVGSVIAALSSSGMPILPKSIETKVSFPT